MPTSRTTATPREKGLFEISGYHRMAEVENPPEDDQVEPIERKIARMNPIGSRHAACVGSVDAPLNGRTSKPLWAYETWSSYRTFLNRR